MVAYLRFDAVGLGGETRPTSATSARTSPVSPSSPVTSRWRRGRTGVERLSLGALLLLIGGWAGLRLDSALLGTVAAGMVFLIVVAVGATLGSGSSRRR